MLGRIVKEGARALGIEIRRYRPFELRRARRLADRGIATVLDVGAGRGQYGTMLRARGYTGRILSFEPVPEAFAELRSRSSGDSEWEIHNVALGAGPGRLTMNVASNLASSSLLPMLPELKDAVPDLATTASVEVQVARLDDYDVGAGPVLLKLDVQGYEGRVLDGAARTLDRVALLECELSLAELYDGQSDFADIVARLNGRGLRVVDLDPFFYDARDGRVLSIDALFERLP